MLRFLPVLTGLLLAAAFPKASRGAIAWLAFIPLLIFLFHAETRWKAFRGGFLAAVIQLFISLIWIPPVLGRYGGLSSVLAWIAYAFLVSGLACYTAFACAAMKHLMIRGRSNSFLLLFPVIWVMMEYAQTLTPFGGFPWLLTGYTQSSRLAIIQMADITGVYGLSFLILCMNTAIAWICIPKNRGRVAYVILIAAGFLVAGSLVYGQFSLRYWSNIHPDFNVAMLQGNISIEDPEEIMAEKFQQGYLQMAEALGTSKIDLLILPESPTPILFQYNTAYRQSLEQLSRRFPLGMIFNNIRPAEEREGYFNSAYFINRKGIVAGVYDKIHLVPFGEYIPMRKLFFFYETIAQDAGDFLAGKDYRIIEIEKRPSNAIICFEAIFPQLVRRFVKNGSQLIINLTNDGWYGKSAAPYQHLAITRLRAVENRRYLIRATNSGFSAVIEPCGRIQPTTGLMQKAIGQGRFSFITEKSFYSRNGDVFVFLCAIILAGFAFMAEIRNTTILKGKVSGGINARRTE
jgi:apolipoprotein N-acyltransferase